MATPFIGEIRMFGFGRTPQGWQACDGSLLSISEYETLFVLIGTLYGGDGQNTFAVPDLRGRVPLHQGQGPGLSNYVIAHTSGTETVTLDSLQMPAHTHTLVATPTAATATAPAGLLPGIVTGDVFYATDTTGATAAPMATQSTTIAGGGQAHDNTMPTLTVQYCISTAGIFPQQS
ncbi:phage tail protein [Xanthomonas arboricola]|uniref:phage tail protein n=1 Tax=Xanthomonas arboricola TaxID=56448 RepID=UPI000CEEFF58|nr:tail fiber protein [Xanthomonas arboricola]MBB4707728.1 microcystin-dependent protein [Xanthomonas arboricola]PPT56419.1 phage tail protein [Xanthomonas arboricola]PPT61771.1 phage tail protein [Xanthomonas arboricola]